MRQTLLFGLLATFVLASLVTAEELPPDRQREIIENYLYVRGQRSTPSTVGADLEGGEQLPPVKCGTPAILEFYRNYESLDRNLVAALGAQLASRPVMAYSYDTPGGHIRVHYDKTGVAAVWQANVDSDGDGVPDYVETFGLIADSAYSFMTDTLGYPAPEVDSAEAGGEDARSDIYLTNMPSGVYGFTYPVYTQFSYSGRRTTPGWVEMDNDFQQLKPYVGRPLDAARVTLAHEMFHLSHFVMDPTEDIVWFEMSSTWMEETQYDEINDYYIYLPYFFNYPKRSLHSQVLSHEYASVLFPIFLSETYDTTTDKDRGIIKSIWRHAADSLGPTFLSAVDFCVDSASGGTEDFNTTFADFSVWNFFTGTYADQAPNGIGYSERANYPYIPLDAMDLHRTYPMGVASNPSSFQLEPNAAAYIRFENLEAAQSDTGMLCRVFTDTVPEVSWGLTAIYQMANVPDSHFVETAVVPARIRAFTWALFGHTIDITQYRSMTLVVSPTTTIQQYIYDTATANKYNYIYRQYGVGYSMSNRTHLDSTLLNVPSAVLAPYPNPAVVAEMGGSGLTFRFRLPTDSTTYPAYPSAYLLVDLFTIAGERMKTLEGVFVGEDRTGVHREGIYEAQWDMRNDGGNEVASGAYLAYARLYESSAKVTLLAEDRVKVAVIR